MFDEIIFENVVYKSNSENVAVLLNGQKYSPRRRSAVAQYHFHTFK